MKIHFDATSNILKNPDIKKQIKEGIEKDMIESIPKIMERMEEIPSFLTTEVGIYSQLLDEAKACYIQGIYYGTVAMIGITAERFCIELSEKLKFKINEIETSEKELFYGREIQKQDLRLKLLEKAKIINQKACEKLKEIEGIRNRYIHPRESNNAKDDALKMLKLFITILNSRFSESYGIKEGKIVEVSTGNSFIATTKLK